MMLANKLAAVGLALAGLTFLSASAQPAKEGTMAGPKHAICVLSPTKGSNVMGTVVFTQKGDAVEITGDITGLTPGNHGFHVHEFGDLSSNAGLATGGHFNPEKEKHGGPHAAMRHVGDLGNIVADDNGKVTLHLTDKLIQLRGKHSIIGRGLIVHAKADDLKTDPTGDAGGRVAQGVIGVGKAPK